MGKIQRSVGLAALFALLVIGYVLYKFADWDPASFALAFLFLFNLVDAFFLGSMRFTQEDMQALNESASRRRQRSISSLSDLSEAFADETIHTAQAPVAPTAMKRLSGLWHAPVVKEADIDADRKASPSLSDAPKATKPGKPEIVYVNDGRCIRTPSL